VELSGSTKAFDGDGQLLVASETFRYDTHAMAGARASAKMHSPPIQSGWSATQCLVGLKLAVMDSLRWTPLRHAVRHDFHAQGPW
jgi:hypothetical protein